TVKQRLHEIKIERDDRAAGTIVAVSGGYPGSYEKGFEITGLDKKTGADSLVFHAGTRLNEDKVITNGGRVLCVTSFAETVPHAVARSGTVLEKIDFEGMYYRKDIGYEF